MVAKVEAVTTRAGKLPKMRQSVAARGVELQLPKPAKYNQTRSLPPAPPTTRLPAAVIAHSELAPRLPLFLAHSLSIPQYNNHQPTLTTSPLS